MQTYFESYKSHKKVLAAKVIYEICSDEHNVTFRMSSASGYEFDFTVTREFITRSNCQVGGYIVQYEDGYLSWSPAKAFEDGYTLDRDMSFTELCDRLKDYSFVFEHRMPQDSSKPIDLALWLNGERIANGDFELFGFRCGGAYSACQQIKLSYTTADFNAILKTCIRLTLEDSERVRSDVHLTDVLTYLRSNKQKNKAGQSAFEYVHEKLTNDHDKICKYRYINGDWIVSSPKKLSNDLVYLLTRRIAYEQARRGPNGVNLTEPSMHGYGLEFLRTSTNDVTNVIVTDSHGQRTYCSISSKMN